MKQELIDFFEKQNTSVTITTYSEEQTKDLGFHLASYLTENDIVSLDGELGSGKTVLMAGIASRFHIENEVSSPTFTIVNEYLATNMNIYHFDVYRIESSDNFQQTIGTDYFSNGLCIIEWGNIIQNILPIHTIFIDITKINETERVFQLRRKYEQHTSL